ncbi:hypothetical protein HY29_17690 [Hyphomonas beringensis]|uniref:Uncharacterized protein n=1 Tax=Hyphomonas beringensis TaxID=1280946 RepID=A0A062UAL8_9PROT|nr:hypothetical protein HY29_17690 [Hyphomonas beringensis]
MLETCAQVDAEVHVAELGAVEKACVRGPFRVDVFSVTEKIF